MKNLQFFHKRSVSKLVIFLLIINSIMFTDAFYNQSYATPTINEMNINATDNEVSVYGTGDGNGTALADKPFRYTIGSSQSEWVRDASSLTVNETLTAGTLSNTSVVNNSLQLSTTEGIYPNGYIYRSIITIDHTKIDTNLTNFPLTVYLNSSNFDFTKAKADGTDIRFTDANLNPLKFEREEHSATNSKAVYNVLVPSVSNAADTVIYMWYGNPNAYNTSIEAWQDQTGKQLTYNGNVKLVTGVQSEKRMAGFDGSGDYLTCPSNTDFTIGSLDDFCVDVVAIFYGTAQGAFFQTETSLSSTVGTYWFGYYNGALCSSRHGNNSYLVSYAWTPIIGQKYHLRASRENGVSRLFIDGQIVATSTIQNGISFSQNGCAIGALTTPLYFNGYMDELRFSKGTARETTNYVLPTEPYSVDQYTKLLLHFDTIYDSNYTMVQHMGDNLTDATGNGNTGNATGTTVINTDFGKARDITSVSTYISEPNAISTNTITEIKPFTLSLQVKFDSVPDYSGLIGTSNGGGASNKWAIYYYTSVANRPENSITFETCNKSGVITEISTPWIPTIGIWYNITLKRDGNEWTWFVNGIPIGSQTSPLSVPIPTTPMRIGTDGEGWRFHDGLNVTTRISNIARSDAWIKAESLSLKNSLVTYSNPTSPYPSSGIRESGVYDISGLVSGSRVQWMENKPAGTNIIVESNVSVNGGSSWLGWKTCSNGDSIADLTAANSSNVRLKLRQTLSTSNILATPSLINSVITINFSKYIYQITAEPNKEYTVKFEIMGANGATTSSIKDVYTKAQQPLFTVTNSTTNSLDLLFTDSNPDTTEYQIMCDNGYVNSSGVLTSVPTWITLNHKSITALGLNIGTMYNFNVKARNAEEEETNYASPINISTQGVPVPTGSAILAATALNNSVTLGWNEIPNSLSYEIELDGVIKNVGLNTSYIHKDLMTNTQHIYRVRGRNQEGFSDWSNLVTITTTNNLPLIPTNVVAKASNNSISVYWSSAQDALTYTVEIDGTEITDVSKNSACLFGLEPETTYSYRVKACNLAGESEWSETGTITTNYLNTPEITQTESDSNTITIGWDKVGGATSYQIALDANENFRTLYPADLEEFATDSSITFTHDNLPIKTAHVYRVRAVCPDGVSAWSDSVTLETLPQRPAAPTNFRGNASNNFITLIWDAVQDVIGYDLEVDGIVIENDNTPQYKYKGLDQYTEHTYRVRSVNSEIESYWSNMLKIRTLGGIPDEPKNVVITNSRGIATLDWDKTPGALNYDVEVNNTLYTISKDTFVYRCVPLSTSSTAIYQETAYRLRAGNDLGKSDWSDYYVNNAIMAKVEKGKELDLGLTASNILDFSRYTLYVNYNDKALTVADLCAYSVEKELGPGMVEGHDIEIVSFSPGHIVFRVNKIINEGYLWTGIINNIKFVGNATGGSTITYTARCSKE